MPIPTKIYAYLASKISHDGKAFSFSGKGSEMFILFLSQFLLILITLGIYTPWAIAKVYSYLASKAKWGEDAFAMQMSGGKYFSIALKGVLLTIITFGIYYWWYQAELLCYEADCTSVGA